MWYSLRHWRIRLTKEEYLFLFFKVELKTKLPQLLTTLKVSLPANSGNLSLMIFSHVTLLSYETVLKATLLSHHVSFKP